MRDKKGTRESFKSHRIQTLQDISHIKTTKCGRISGKYPHLILFIWTFHHRVSLSLLPLKTQHPDDQNHLSGISLSGWSGMHQNTRVLQQARTASIWRLIMQHQSWYGHVKHGDSGRIPKDVMFNDLVTGASHEGYPQLKFKDVCKHESMPHQHGRWEEAAEEIRTKTTQQKSDSSRREQGKPSHHLSASTTTAWRIALPGQAYLVKAAMQSPSDRMDHRLMRQMDAKKKHFCWNLILELQNKAGGESGNNKLGNQMFAFLASVPKTTWTLLMDKNVFHIPIRTIL